MRTTAILPSMLAIFILGGCSSCGGSTAGDALVEGEGTDEMDTRMDEAMQDTEPDAVDTTEVRDTFEVTDDTGGDDPALDAVFDPIPSDCWELDYGAEAVPGFTLVPVATTRTPTPCGDGCRQVKLTEDELWNVNYSVWGGYLAFDTYMVESGSYFKRVWLVDLDTLQHYIVDERDAYEEGTPSNAVVTLTGSTLSFLTKTDIGTWGYHFLMHQYSFDASMQVTGQVLYENFYAAGGAAMLALSYNGRWYSWYDFRDYPAVTAVSQVYVFDTESRTECLVSIPGENAGKPSMSGDRVVFESGDIGQADVFMYDIGTGETVRVTGAPGDQFDPVVSEDVVVWADTRSGGTMWGAEYADIYMLDLTSSVETPVCLNSASQHTPAIGGEIIVWSDCRHDPDHSNEPYWAHLKEIYMYDIPTGTETRLTNLPGLKHNASVFENRVYFLMEDAGGITSVFEITLP